jgi:cytochrome c-type biogenesis protein CcmF
MTVAHIGLATSVIAISCVQTFTIERDIAVGVGETAPLGAYAFRFDEMSRVEGPNYDGVRARITVLHHGKPLTVLHPEKRQYWVQNSVLTEAGIYTHWGTDVFAALGEDLGGGRWSIRTQLRPLVDFVWLGAFIMAFGGLLAASDKRYRTARSAATEEGREALKGSVA